MSKKFKIYKDPHEEGKIIYEKSSLELQEGLTILVGCNGSGKTTLLNEIIRNLEKENIKYLHYDNLHDGTERTKSNAGFFGNFEIVATLMQSSEGEGMIVSLGIFASKIRKHISENNQDEVWILLDALDSGLSIDNIQEVKQYLFQPIKEDCEKANKKLYLIVVANSYEMAREENCLDVISLKYRNFKTYEAYKSFVLKSREKKEKRYE